MSERKKPVKVIECVLCRKPKGWNSPYNSYENHISEWSKVCCECEKMWELGKKTMAASKSDGKGDYGARPHRNAYDAEAGGSARLYGSSRKGHYDGARRRLLRGTQIGRRFGEKGEIISVTKSTDDDDNWYIGGGSLEFKVPRARAEAMGRVVGAFFNAIAKARVDGFEEGRNLLSGLAKGTVSLESFSEQADNTRAGKKPRRRGGD